MNTFKVIDALKTELRKNKITYSQIAGRLGITEAGVKKLLNKEDISLKKIEIICEVLNLPVAELLKRADDENVQAVRFTEKQTSFFLSKPHYFHFFMKVAYEQKTPKEIQHEFNLSTRSIMLYLKKLEEIGLIKRHPNDHHQIIGGIPLAVNTKGTKLEILKHEIATKLLSDLKNQSLTQLKGAGFFLSSEQAENFAERIQTTVYEFSSLSRANRKKTIKSNFRDLTFMSFVANLSMFYQVTEL